MKKMGEEDAKSDREAAERLDNVQELLNATAEFDEASEDKSTAAYLAQVSLLTTSDDKQDKADKVTLMTVHIAKGLEFTSVFLTGMEEGLFPLGEAQFGQEELEEERRLAYVGMTRAKEQLYLTCAASRRLYGQTRWKLPSRLLPGAGPESGGPAADIGRRPDIARRAPAPLHPVGAEDLPARGGPRAPRGVRDRQGDGPERRRG